MAKVQLVPGDTIRTSSVVIRSEADGDVRLTVAEALDIALELPMAINNLNGLFWSKLEIKSSSNIKRVEYQRSTARLRIEFSKGIYVYYGVPPNVVDAMLQAPSLGGFVQQEIVKQPNEYPFAKE